nr:protein AATF-like isoform X1 [Ipomoea batatas]
MLGGVMLPQGGLSGNVLCAMTNHRVQIGGLGICIWVLEHYAAPANLERLLAANLKVLTENGISTVAVEAYRLDDSACHGSKPYSYARRDNADGNSQLLDDSDFYQQLLKEFFETIDPMSSGANSIGYLVLFVTASAFLLDLLCGSTEQLTLEN